MAFRIAMPGEISEYFHPAAGLLDWIPCSPACEPSRIGAVQQFEKLRAEKGETAAAETTASLRNPWLLVAGSDWNAIELIPRGDVGSRFQFRAGRSIGTHPLLARIAEGDEVVIDEQQIQILRQGELHAVLGARAFVWWHRAAMQTDLWRRLAAIRTANVWEESRMSEEAQTQAPTSSADAGSGANARRIADVLAGALRWSPGSEASLAGFRIEEIRPEHDDEVVLQFASTDSHPLIIHVSPLKPGRGTYVEAGSFAVAYPPESPLDTREKDQLARQLGNLLGKLPPDSIPSSAQPV